MALSPIGWLAARLQEPSTYAGLAALVDAFHLPLQPGIVANIPQLGIAIGGLIAAVLPEARSI